MGIYVRRAPNRPVCAQSAVHLANAASSISNPRPGLSDSVIVPPSGMIGSTNSSATLSAGPVNSSENSCGRMALPTVLYAWRLANELAPMLGLCGIMTLLRADAIS